MKTTLTIVVEIILTVSWFVALITNQFIIILFIYMFILSRFDLVNLIFLIIVERHNYSC